MVKVREDQPVRHDGTVDLKLWSDPFIADYGEQSVQRLLAACRLSNKIIKGTGSGRKHHNLKESSCFKLGLNMVDILVKLKLDIDSLVAAMLYRAVRESQLSLKMVEEEFGSTVSVLIKGVLGMAAIGIASKPVDFVSSEQRQVQLDKIRKMLVSIIDDVRVALIKLAERTCVIRTVIYEDDQDKILRVAREVFDIYAPLAHRLGIGYLKWELEDLSFRYLRPHDYQLIAKLMNEKRIDRESYIENVVEKLESALRLENIQAEVYGRVKHFYSIWRKMTRKGIDFRELYDIRAVRILTKEVQSCYGALGVIHSLWRYIPQEFDDYIATPKENGYQSLHTAVFGPQGKTLEVQIRTVGMHEESELGVCAHWRYKTGVNVDAKNRSYEEKISWLRQVMEWHEELGDLEGLGSQWRSEVEPDLIYIFTKNGDVIDLPVGSTPVDFAYHIHTEVGRKCRGAKVCGRIVPLNHKLQTGDQVNIITADNASPSRDWLNNDLGYITTSRAKAKVVNWFKKQDRESHVCEGKSMLDAELKRLALNRICIDVVAKKVNMSGVEDLYAALGSGDVKLSHVLNIVQKEFEIVEEKPFFHRTVTEVKKFRHGGVDVDGVGDLLTQMAKCCKPVYGDCIVGYITQGKGVTIHRQDCSNALLFREKECERVIEVGWSSDPVEVYPVDIVISVYDRKGLLRDVTTILANEKVNVLSMKTISEVENTANILLTVELSSVHVLRKILFKISRLPNVFETARYNTTIKKNVIN